MSGHSKWSTIKRQKGVTDVKRSQAFTKIANNITIAVRLGGSGDPETNPRLRLAVEQARSANMPKGNIQRAIDRGLGRLPGQNIEELTYEGFGPGKVAYYIEALTDNRLRTNQEIKSLFERSGGTLGNPGSSAYMFDKVGEMKVKSEAGKMKNGEEEILELIDLGAEDVESSGEQEYLVYVQSPELNTMGTKITQSGFEIESQEIVMKPNIIQKIEDKDLAKRVLEFTENLEEHGDIQKVFANFDIPDELLTS